MTAIVMLGAGFIGQMHALSARLSELARGDTRHKVELRQLIETPQGERVARETAARFGFDEVSLRPWIETVGSTQADLFVNAGPNSVHADASIGFAKQGIHVLCEKPLAGTPDEAFRAWQGVSATGVKHMCAFVHRFIPAIRHAREIIKAGEIGEVLQYRSQFLLDMRNPDGSLSWRFVEQGGGAAGDLGSHHIDVARFLVGEVESVSAMVQRHSKDPEGKHTALNDDAFVATARLSGGALATFDASRIAGGHSLTGRIEVDGTRGSLAFDMERLNELRMSQGRTGWRTFLATGPAHPSADFLLPVGIQGAHPAGWRECFAFQMHHMLQAIENRTSVDPIGATMEDGYRVAEVVGAILQSAEDGAMHKVAYREA